MYPNKTQEYTDDGMKPINQRFYPQRRNKKEEYHKEVEEIYEVLDELDKKDGFNVKYKPEKYDMDLFHIIIKTPNGTELVFDNINDVDDLLVVLQAEEENTPEAKEIRDAINKIVD